MRKAYMAILGVAGLLTLSPATLAQVRPYIGFVYPAGGQQGTTFEIRLGGQNLDDVTQVSVSGSGVSARVVEYRRRLNPQDTQLLSEQLKILKKAKPQAGGEMMMMTPQANPAGKAPVGMDEPTRQLVAKIEQRLAEFVSWPACAAISSIVIVEVTVVPDAQPGRRELTLSTLRGVSNPLVFEVSQLPEIRRKPMISASYQVLGKEKLALRKRPADEVEQQITLPCILNGQIASGEVNQHRFQARKGQRLVISAVARELNPFVADAVPGWFQPVMVLRDANGKEVAYDDDYRFKPDPVILYEVPRNGEYVLGITDAIYRGREDFVYRVSIGELPFITSVFPLGGQAGASAKTELKGWNLQGAKLMPPAPDAGPGTCSIAASRDGFISNRVRFELGTLPECLEQEPNNDIAHAQKVTLPIVINGRIDRPDDWDVFAFSGEAGQTIVAEVDARRLESPLDSFLKVTDAAGNVLTFNDDHEDAEAGINTHDADSYLTVKLPAKGTYYVHLGDTARHGGEEYAYRLRISAPRPDFALRIVPSSLGLRSKSTATVNVQVIRKDGFSAPIQLTLKDPPAGFSAAPVALPANQPMARLTIKTDLVDTKQPVALKIEGRVKFPEGTIAHLAVPAEDRMQAFLWRHLVPAQALDVLVFDPTYQPPPKRVPRARPATVPATQPAKVDPAKPKFSKQQVESRLRHLKTLFEDGLINDDFYNEKVVECETAN